MKRRKMAGVKFMVIYPRPTDIEAFEKVNQDEHVPMAVERLGGKTKFVATKVLHPSGIPPFFTVSPRFTSRRWSPGGLCRFGRAKETLAHAVSNLHRRKTDLFGR